MNLIQEGLIALAAGIASAVAGFTCCLLLAVHLRGATIPPGAITRWLASEWRQLLRRRHRQR